MEYHEIANLFPMMEKERMIDLIESIQKDGLIHQITLFEGKILDGRNRFEACEKTGVEPNFAEFTGSQEDALRFVWNENWHRRDLSSSQRAAIVVDNDVLMEQWAEEGKRNQGSTSVKHFTEVNTETRKRNTKTSGTNHTYVAKAKTIKEKSPEVLDAVKNGKISITDGAKIVKEPNPEDILELIDNGTKPKDAIKEIKVETRKIETDKYI